MATKVRDTDLEFPMLGAQDLWVSAGAIYPRISNGCAPITQFEMATSLVNIKGLAFDQTTQEFAQWTMSLPRNWNNGTVTIKPYWTAISGSGAVVWEFKGGAYSNDDALTGALGTGQTSTDTLTATNDLDIGPVTSAITIAGTPADADYLVFQVSRNPADGSDTLTADALLLGVVVTFTNDANKSA